MEIILDSKTVPAYKEISHQIKYIQDSVDSVVPDINEDIVKIAALDHTLLLKSKDITSSGVTVSGEISICVLYITENEDSIAHLKLSKSFNADFDVADIKPTSKAQILLKLNNIESRIINPRKLSAAFEITAELSVYAEDEMDESVVLSPENLSLIKIKEDTIDYLCPVSVCEKTFVINEQFKLSQASNSPCGLISANTQLYINDTQHVGTKLIVKGTAVHNASYLPKDQAHPINSEFTSSFSQIIDTGIDSLDNCVVVPQITSSYYDISETISNECILDTEIHAVIQIVCRKRNKISFVSDAYSNQMPCKCNTVKMTYLDFGNLISQKLSVDEKLSVSDDCTDVLNVYTSVLQAGIKNNKFTAIMCFDIVYTNKSESICAVRRTAELNSDNLPDGARLVNYGIYTTNIRPVDTIIDARALLEFSYYSCTTSEYNKINSIELDEENKYMQDDFPSITLVKHEQESIWDLAKTYHSSVEKILNCNNMENISDKFVIIPREC